MTGSRDVGETIGYQLRRLRRLRGMTQEELADHANVSRDLVAKLEQGRRQSARIASLASLARALDVELSALVKPAGPVPVSITDSRHRRSRAGVGAWDSTTAIIDAGALVERVHRAYQAARYSEVVGLLPSVTDSVDVLVGEGPASTRREAVRLRASVAIAAAKLATKAGDALTGRSAAEQARDAAEDAEDTFGQAASTYQLTCALLRAGGAQERDEAERLAVGSAEDLRGADADSLSWRGALMLIGALIAARRGDPVEAGRRLDHAEDLAHRLGGDRNVGWTAFGPTNVMIHRVSATVALGDPLGALAIAELVDVAAMPSGLHGRQAQLHLDSAWAHAELGDDALAVIHLLDTERVAPELLMISPDARGLIRGLLRRERRAVPGLRGLALRAGVAA
ncbi:MAG: helix-turn-helix domain-containing protein [Solirubrobacteraceae bacterium]